MNKRIIYGLVAIPAMTIAAIGASGCSDNINKDFEPISSVSRTILINGSPKDTTINITAGGGERTITVTSNTRWTVKVDKGGGWCSTDVFGGTGKESFTITILENKGDQDRNCTIDISAVDAEGQQDDNRSLTKTITIIQGKSDVSISPSDLEAFPATETNTSFEIKANTGWTLDITYENAETPHFLSITPGENMQRVGDDKFEGNENARFTLHLANNGSDASRLGFLNLTTDAGIGAYTLEIRQNKSEYTFDVTAEKRTIEPQGGEVAFVVLSHSEWTVKTSDPGVSFAPPSGQGTGMPETTIATISPNLSDTVRPIKILFEPIKENYVPQVITITQNPFPLTFEISPGTLPGVVMKEGGKYTVNVSSMFDWEIKDTPDWIKVTPNNGYQSEAAVTLNVEIDRNVGEMQRDDVITVVPSITKFHGIDINPEKVNVFQRTIPIKQYGGQKPAVSTPWVSEEIGQREAVLTFNYYSPIIEITAAGLRWRKEGASEWTSIPVSITDKKSGTVTVTLSDLDPVTRYEAQGYVIGDDDETYSGSSTPPFTTSGHYPEQDDNPTPSR